MNEEFTIQELCDQTGLPRRTIHFYTQQGILPPPQGSGLGARYQPDHLLRLKLIPVLRQQGLRLDDIRQKFQSSSRGELADAYAHFQSKIAELRIVPPSPVNSPKIVQKFSAYTLPYGMILMVPENGDRDLDKQLQKILHAVQTQ